MNDNLISVPIAFNSDEKGYLDRQCPNEDCEFVFKVHINDWKEKVSDDAVYCPRCGHCADSEQWFTHEQLDELNSRAESLAEEYISNALDKMFGDFANGFRNSEHVKITYKPGPKVTFDNTPIGQREEWELEIACDKCGTRYSVIGSAYFCPCCGHNAVEKVFSESLDTVEKMLASLADMKGLFAAQYGNDKAETMCQSLLEGTLSDIVSAFQKYAEVRYRNFCPDAKVRVNDFQIVSKGSQLFYDAVGRQYSDWISCNDIETMNLQFQRRHILEHNNGIVDERYLKQSGDTAYIQGQRIVVKEYDATQLLNIIRKLCEGLKGITNISNDVGEVFSK